MSYTKKPKITAAQKAGMLKRYIEDITSNDKRFPGSCRKTIVVDLNNGVANIARYIRMGDKIVPDSTSEYEMKRLLLKLALSSTVAFSADFVDAAESDKTKIGPTQLKVVSGYIKDIENMLTFRIKGLENQYKDYARQSASGIKIDMGSLVAMLNPKVINI